MILPTLALLIVSLLWGTTFVAVKTGLDDVSPLLFVGIRFSIATLASVPLLRTASARRPALLAGLPLGAVLALSYATQTMGLSLTTPARSAFVTGLNVAIVPLWALAFLGVRARPLSLLGLAVAVPGLWILTSPGSGGWNAGDAWTLACAVFFALHVVMINRWGPRHDAGGLLVGQLAVTAVLCLAAAPLLEVPRLVPTGRLAIALLITAVLATTGTTWLQLRFQPRVDPTRAALVYATEPLFATGFSWLFTGEVLPPSGWLGGGLIVAGMVMSELGSRSPGDPAGATVVPVDRPARRREAPR